MSACSDVTTAPGNDGNRAETANFIGLRSRQGPRCSQRGSLQTVLRMSLLRFERL